MNRAALALIAILCGGMGFIESIAAVPAQSTALAADALLFLRESAFAWIAMWVSVGAFRRTALIARLIGAVMIALGAGVLAIALGRLRVGSAPEAMTIIGFGAFALAAQLTAGALALRARGTAVSLPALWRVAGDACGAHLLVIAAAIAIIAARTNIGDIAVGGALAAIFFLNGILLLVRGRLTNKLDG